MFVRDKEKEEKSSYFLIDTEFWVLQDEKSYADGWGYCRHTLWIY